MDTIDTEKLQTVLAILKAAGVSHFECGGLKLEIPVTPAVPAVKPPAVLTPANPAGGYDLLFGGQRPVFPGSE